MSKLSSKAETTGEALQAETQTMIGRLTHSAAATEAKALATKVRDGVEGLKEKYEDTREQIQEGVASTEEAIKHHPWGSLGAAAGAGLAGGYLLGRLTRPSQRRSRAKRK